MAYNPNLYMNYGQQSYPQPVPQMQPMPQMQPTQQPFDLLISVSGKDGANAFQMPPNSRAVLFDTKEDILYKVTTDGAGYKTVQEFDFKPREQQEQKQDMTGYVSKADFDALAARVDQLEPKPRQRKAANDNE